MEKNKIYLGDCLELMPKHIEDKSIDMIFCDLPYQKTRNKWDTMIPFDALWKHYKRIIKDRGIIVLFGQKEFSAKVILSNETMYKYSLVWNKVNPSGFLNAKRMPMMAHEDIMVFYKKAPTYNPQKFKGDAPSHKSSDGNKSKKNGNYGDFTYSDKVEEYGDMKYPRSILEFKRDAPTKMLHPTQKPLELIEYIIKSYTNEGDLILDNTCGSGTTGRGAKNLNRDYIMMEMNKEYYEIANKRLED